MNALEIPDSLRQHDRKAVIRAIKLRCASMVELKLFTSAADTIAGIELAHRIRKRQFLFGRGRHGRTASLKQLWEQALA